MKKLNKVLAMLLAILTVLTAVPISVIAEPWFEVDGETTVNGTEGSNSKLTITVDADRLAEILKTNGLSSEALASLKSGISVDKDAIFNIFSLEEIFEIVPQEKLLDAVDLEKLLEDIDVTDYINVSELLANSNVDVKALLDLLPDGSDIRDYVNMSLLIKYVDPADALGYVEMSELINYVNIQLFVEKAGSNLDQIVVFSELFADDVIVLNDGAVSFEQIVEAGLLTAEIMEKLVDQGAVKPDKLAVLFDNVSDPMYYFDRAKVESDVYPYVNPTDFLKYIQAGDLAGFTEFDIITDNIVATDVVSELVKNFIDYDRVAHDVDYNAVIKYISIEAIDHYVDLVEVEHWVDLDKVTQYVDVDKVQQYVDIATVRKYVDLNKVNSYIDIEAISSYFEPTKFNETDLDLSLLTYGTDYTLNVATGTVSLTAAGLNKIAADPSAYLNQTVINKIKADPLPYLNAEGAALVENDPMSFLTTEGADLVEKDPMSFLTTEGADLVEKDPMSFLTQAGKNAVKNEPVDFLTADGKYIVDHAPMDFLSDEGVKRVEEDVLDFLTDEGVEAFQNDPMGYLTAEGKAEVQSNPYQFLNEDGKKDFANDPLAFLTDEGHEAVKHDPMKYITQECKDKIAANPRDYLTDSGMDKITDVVLNRVSIPEILEMYKNTTGFISAVLKSAKIDLIAEMDGFSACVDYAKAIEVIGLDNIINNPDIDIDYSKLDLSKLKTVSNIDKYINKEKLGLISNDDLFLIFGGEDNLMNCVDMDAAMKDTALLNKVFAAIKNDTSVALSQVIYINKYLSVVDYADVLRLLGYDSPVDLLGADAIKDILTKVDLAPYLKDIVTVVLDRVLWNVDLITIDGEAVASENVDSAVLEIDTEALLNALIKLIPTLKELSELDSEVLLSTNIGITYLPELVGASSKTKNITVELVLEGGIDRLKMEAAKLDALLRQYVDFNVNPDGSIYFGINAPNVTIPAGAAELYRRLLDSDKLTPELKQKLLNFTNVDGVLGFVETLTLDEIVTMMKLVDVNALYNVILNAEYVQRVINKVESVTKINIPELTLDEWKDLIVASPSIEDICNKLTAKTGRDVMALLESAADKFDAVTEIDRVQQMLDYVSNTIGYDLSDLSAREILDRVSDAPLTERVLDAISAKIGKDIMGALENNTVEELYNKALDAAASRTDAYKKVLGYVDLLQSYLPAQIMNYRIADSYQGNSYFYDDITMTVPMKKALEKVVNKLTEKIDRLPEDKIDLIMGYIPEKNVTVHFELGVTVTNLYEITFKNEDGSVTYTSVFMPAGTDLSIYNNAFDVGNLKFESWTLKDGTVLTEMPARDVVVYAKLSEESQLAYVEIYDTNGNLIIRLPVGVGSSLSDALKNAMKGIADQMIVDAQNKPSYDPTKGYYKVEWRDENGNLINPDKTPITTDLKLTPYLVWIEYKYVTVYDENGTANGPYRVDKGEPLSDEIKNAMNEIANRMIANAKQDPSYDPNKRECKVEWRDEKGNLININTVRVNADMKLTPTLKWTWLTYDTDSGISFGKAESFKDRYVGFDTEKLQDFYNEAKDGETYTITAKDEKGNSFDYVQVNKKMAKLLLDKGVDGVMVSKDSTVNAVYKDANALVYGFDFVKKNANGGYDVVKVSNDFDNGVEITIPTFGHKVDNEWRDDGRETVLAILNGNELIPVGIANSVTHLDGRTFVSFYAPHFSEVIFGYRYSVGGTFYVDGNKVSSTAPGFELKLNDLYFAGTSMTITQGTNLIFDTNKYELDYISVNGTKITGVTFEMPEGKANVSIYLKEKEEPPKPPVKDYKVIFLANGMVVHTAWYNEDVTANNGEVEDYFKTIAAQVVANKDITAPKGYTKNDMEWVYDASKLGTEDVYVVARWIPVQYKVIFKSEEANSETERNFTIENYLSLVAPDVPEISGKIGAWEAYDLSKLFDGTETELVVKAIYTAASYTVIIQDAINGTTVSQNEVGKPVTLPTPAQTNGFAYSYSAITASGIHLDVVNGVIAMMPAETVYVTVVYTPNDVTYTVNGTSYTAKYGTLVPLDIVIQPGQVLAVAPTGCSFIGSTTGADGTVTLHYVFKLTESANITYTVEGQRSALLKIFNGNIYEGTEDPADLRKNVHFARWSEAYGGFSFAIFEVKDSASLLWLWILLSVLILALLIMLVYLLYINGKIGVNFLTRAVAWIVGLFLTLCLAIARLGMKISALFGGDSDDDSDNGQQAAKKPQTAQQKKTETPKSAAPKADSSNEKEKNGKKKPGAKGKGGKKLNHKKKK